MKRSTVFFLALVLIALVGIAYIPVTITKSVKVPYTMDKTMEQLLNPVQLIKWYFDSPGGISGTPTVNRTAGMLTVSMGTEKISIQPVNPATVDATITEANGNVSKLRIVLSPDPAQPAQTFIHQQLKGSVSQKLLPASASGRKPINTLHRLSAFMEDTRRMYGFNITRTRVQDTSYLFSTKVVATGKIREGMEDIFTGLVRFAEQNGIRYNGARIFHRERINRDSTQLFASIAINSYVPDHPSDSIMIKHMPYQKNLLQAEFEGPYKNIDSVYAALEAYKRDHSLIQMAIPYQKFLMEGYSFSDTQHVRINVYFPFY